MRRTALSLMILVAGCQPVGPKGSTDRPFAVASGHGPNAVRADAGLAPLRRDARLDRAARDHATDMAQRDFIGHRGSDGSRHHGRLRRVGYPSCGAAENLAKGPYDRSSVVAAWQASPKHRRNMLLERVGEYGMAQVGDAWVMLLARPC